VICCVYLLEGVYSVALNIRHTIKEESIEIGVESKLLTSQ